MEEEKEQFKSLSEIVAEFDGGYIFPYYLEEECEEDFPDTIYFSLLDSISKNEEVYQKILRMCYETGLSAVQNIISLYPEFFKDRPQKSDILAIDYLFMVIGEENDVMHGGPIAQGLEYFGEEIGYCKVGIYIFDFKKTFELLFGKLEDNGIDLKKFMIGSEMNAYLKTFLLDRAIGDFAHETSHEFFDNRFDKFTPNEVNEDIFIELLGDYFEPDGIAMWEQTFREKYPELRKEYRETRTFKNISTLTSNHQNIFQKLKFANDVLGIPPMMTFFSTFVEDESIKLSERDQYWLTNMFDFYFFEENSGYEKKMVVLNDEISGIKEAPLYIKAHPLKPRYHFLTKEIINPNKKKAKKKN